MALLHSYRYEWAKRALKCGYPERFAQQALGHNSKAVHHAYSKRAEVTVPSLDDWEKQRERRAGLGSQASGASGQGPENGMSMPKLVVLDFQAEPGGGADVEDELPGRVAAQVG